MRALAALLDGVEGVDAPAEFVAEQQDAERRRSALIVLDVADDESLDDFRRRRRTSQAARTSPAVVPISQTPAMTQAAVTP